MSEGARTISWFWRENELILAGKWAKMTAKAQLKINNRAQEQRADSLHQHRRQSTNRTLNWNIKFRNINIRAWKKDKKKTCLSYLYLGRFLHWNNTFNNIEQNNKSQNWLFNQKNRLDGVIAKCKRCKSRRKFYFSRITLHKSGLISQGRIIMSVTL